MMGFYIFYVVGILIVISLLENIKKYIKSVWVFFLIKVNFLYDVCILFFE